jgi:RNA polymerase sigma-70 factor (ECF subfamily)
MTVGMASAVASVESRHERFAAVVRGHQAMVFSIAFHFLRDRERAEEIAQEVFLQLYRSGGDLSTEAHVTFWLRKVACHRAIDFARKRKFEVALEDAPEPATPNANEDPWLNRRIRVLLTSLPETPRMVMVLRYQEDLMPEEIARVLEMPVRTVKSHLQRSLAMLREKFDRTSGSL